MLLPLPVIELKSIDVMILGLPRKVVRVVAAVEARDEAITRKDGPVARDVERRRGGVDELARRVARLDHPVIAGEIAGGRGPLKGQRLVAAGREPAHRLHLIGSGRVAKVPYAQGHIAAVTGGEPIEEIDIEGRGRAGRV